jgi:hypothetical protein
MRPDFCLRICYNFASANTNSTLTRLPFWIVFDFADINRLFDHFAMLTKSKFYYFI